MTAHQILLKKIKEAIELASQLSKTEHDQYAKCIEELMPAKDCLNQDLDRSAECKCACHTGRVKHCAPCSCYSGIPKK